MRTATFHFPGVVVRVHSPELTEEAFRFRKRAVQKTAEGLGKEILKCQQEFRSQSLFVAH